MPDLYGGTIYSSNYTGKVVILDFWATWCSPCKAEMPDLVALQDKYRADGLAVIGADVSWSQEDTQTRTTLEQQIIPLLYGNARLGCRRSGSQMTLSWPTNALTFTLESATNPIHPVWSTWPTAPSVIKGTNTVQAPMTNSARYFRLRMPY